MEPVFVALAALLVLGLGGYILLGGSILKPVAPSSQIDAFATAIAKQEGSNPTWNNPGDLTKSFGFSVLGVMNADGVLRFATSDDGWKALYKQLQDIVDGNSHFSLSMSLSSFGLEYSGDPNWATNVAGFLGVDTNTTLGQILGVS